MHHTPTSPTPPSSSPSMLLLQLLLTPPARICMYTRAHVSILLLCALHPRRCSAGTHAWTSLRLSAATSPRSSAATQTLTSSGRRTSPHLSPTAPAPATARTAPWLVLPARRRLRLRRWCRHRHRRHRRRRRLLLRHVLAPLLVSGPPPVPARPPARLPARRLPAHAARRLRER